MSDPLFPAPPSSTAPEKKPERPPVPKEVNIAFAVWVLSAIVMSVIQLLDLNATVEQYLKLTADQPEMQAPPGTIKLMLIFTQIVLTLVVIAFAWAMRSGKNWARALLTAWAVFSLVTQASAVGTTSVIGMVAVVILAAGLVYMYMPPSNAYFRSFRKVPPRA
ncbi:hypothetical protein KIPE111705_18230 [Kibdelosporangium persicum]|uniref:Uncharacterized protein n=1 Tax=Kibdelosporangium persicum TaxID=2698649 RepID=A0ABX2FCI5_9PSEU|nr:hypothetical protein [Kibdelosporangium persicum]NRN68597.1 hypothetical protein [Kibdelosporangium persicum]